MKALLLGIVGEQNGVIMVMDYINIKIGINIGKYGQPLIILVFIIKKLIIVV
jgi:hypothetical protein